MDTDKKQEGNRRRSALRQPAFIRVPLAVWCVLVVAVAYGDALTLPFFFDDLIQIPFVRDHTLPELWTTTGPIAYYRPLPLTLWKLALPGPFAHHLLNLALHTANGWLVGWLAGWMGRGWRVARGESHPYTPHSTRHTLHSTPLHAFLAATLFLLYPFSTQAVPFVGALTQILVVTLVLASVATYVQGRATGERRWLAASLLFTALAPFAHENGVLVGPLVLALELVKTPGVSKTPGVWRAVRRGVWWWAPALLWLPLWWGMPKPISGGIALNGPEALGQNAVYFLQGMAFPLTWLGGWLARLGAGDLPVAGGLGMVALGGALVVQVRQGRLRPFPWLWMALAFLPAGLFLRFDYVINGPRLLMLASAGAAWLWADVFTKLLLHEDPKGLRPLSRHSEGKLETLRVSLRLILVVAALLVVLGQSLWTVRARMGEHRMLGEVVDAATAATVAANASGRDAAFVNFPSWVAPARNTYAVGHEGPLFWPDYAPPPALVSAQTGAPASLHLARVDAVRPETAYHVGLAGGGPEWDAIAAGASEVFVAAYGPETIDLRPAGGFPPTAPETTLAHFAGERGALTLLDATAVPTAGGVRVTLTWRVEAPPAAGVTVFAHLVDGGGQLVAQADGDWLAGTYAPVLAPAGQVIRDVRFVAGDGTALRIGLYRRDTGTRLTATDPAGGRLPDDAFTVVVGDPAGE